MPGVAWDVNATSSTHDERFWHAIVVCSSRPGGMDAIRSRPLASSSLDLVSHAAAEELVSHAAPARSAAPSPEVIPLERVSTNVLLCHRPVTFLPPAIAKGVAFVGGDHQWLKAGGREVGMGRDDGTVPLDRPDYPGIPSRMVDHTGQAARPESSCEIIPDVDPDCVEKSIASGQPAGRWWPLVNDCHTLAEDILVSCARPGEAPEQSEREGGVGRP